MIELKTPAEIEAMHAAGVVVADILAATRAEAKVGVALTELDRIARQVLADAGASSPFLGYQPGFAQRPFPAVICTSVNDAVLHGIPDRYRLRDGDLLSVDCGAVLDGWAGDAAISLIVGQPRKADEKFIATAEAGWAAAMPAASAASAVAMNFLSAGRGWPTISEIAASPAHPSSTAPQSTLSRSPSRSR